VCCLLVLLLDHRVGQGWLVRVWLARGLMLMGMVAKVASWKEQRALRGCEEGGVVVEGRGGFLVRVQGGDVWKSDILVINFRLAIVALARCYFMARNSGCNMHSIRGSSQPAHVRRRPIPGVQEHVLLLRLLRTDTINTCPYNDDSIYTSWLCYVIHLAAGVALVVQIKQLLRLGND
jgi:hypothetical protein